MAGLWRDLYISLGENCRVMKWGRTSSYQTLCPMAVAWRVADGLRRCVGVMDKRYRFRPRLAASPGCPGYGNPRGLACRVFARGKFLMRRLVLFVPLALFAVMALLFKVMIGHDPSVLELARKGQPVPVFELPDLHNPRPTVDATDLLGKLFVKRLATWCPSCRAEHPMLVDLARRRCENRRIELQG